MKLTEMSKYNIKESGQDDFDRYGDIVHALWEIAGVYDEMRFLIEQLPDAADRKMLDATLKRLLALGKEYK